MNWMTRNSSATHKASQGEMVAAKYSQPASARRNLETLVTATLEATCLDAERLDDDAARFATAMASLSSLALRSYRDLVDHPRFVEFFRQITPIAEIADLSKGEITKSLGSGTEKVASC